MACTALVAVPDANGNPGPSNPPQEGEHYLHAQQTRPDPSSLPQVNVTDVSYFGGSFQNKGLSERALSVISSSWRKSTQRQYIPYLNKWGRYCRSRLLDPLSATVEEGVNFLAIFYDEVIGYSALNTARSALSTVFTLQNNQTFGTHPLVTRFMKGVFETRPSLPVILKLGMLMLYWIT